LNPRLIVLDEAVSRLDMLIQVRLQEEMGTSYLFIFHDIRVLLKMAHRLLVMHEGRLVDEIALDSQDRGGNSPRHPAFGQLMQAILPPLAIKAVAGAEKRMVNPDDRSHQFFGRYFAPG
jgi:ABC-type glutathione transport system ATPase component